MQNGVQMSVAHVPGSPEGPARPDTFLVSTAGGCDTVFEKPSDRTEIERWVAELHGELTDDPARMSACLVNLDYLPMGLPVTDLLKPLSRNPPCPTAVHGYNLTDAEREWFACHGILTFSRLSRAALVKLLT
jgi:hypothetical protein